MDLSPLPKELRAKIERRVRKKPALTSVIERWLAMRAGAQSDDERASYDRMLENLLAPSRFGRRLILAIFVFGGSIVGYSIYRDQQVERAASVGTPTIAQVERMEPGSCFFGTDTASCLELTVKLYPASGAPYSASFTQLIPLEWMSRVQPGAWLTVAVDPVEPQKVTFDVRTMYVAPPAPPASAP